MATLIPAPSNVEAAYEDMFKEITRKLYGEETGNGLHTLGTPVAQVATTGPTAPEGERSFTNLQIDRSAAPTIEYEHNAGNVAASAAVTAAAAAANANVVIQQQPEGSVVVATTGGGANFKTEDHHLNTAFGLAALMQNGFTTTATAATTGGGGGAGDQQPQQQQPQIVQWTTTTGGKLQSYTTTQQQQPQQQVVNTKSKSKNRNDHAAALANAAEVIYASPSTSGNAVQQQQQQIAATTGNTSTGGGGGRNKKSNNTNNNQQQQQNSNQNGSNGSAGVQLQKRYACTHCPYSTDRRDLYTRHENIHKDEKPFQCYACLKQFNRADHVKKHFLRMHREMQYDINKTRRHVPSSTSSASNHHAGGRGNVTINTTAANVQIDNAFLESQRQPTSSSLSIAETIEAVATAADEPLPQLKQEKNDDGSIVVGGGSNGTIKPKREKRFTCCYCPWSGADKWGLKRHLNTHTKPFVCLLCDYKAARSERLATHVLKVHNKRACNKCSFLADSQEEYQTHISEVHPHDNRPSRSSNNNSNNTSNNTNNSTATTNNLNVLRTIGNTLVTNNQLNTFQNSNTTFGLGNSTTTTTVGNAGGSVTIYTTTTTDNGNIAGGGPLQEIIVNPTSMVGWRLSANGSLIPPHDLLTSGLPNAAAQKRGSERLFQYLEADGSDPEDYARLLKMDAISRNTASVAQDFHKAGGVHELKIPANHQLLFNNKLPSQWTTREAAALLHSLSNNINLAYEQQKHLQQHPEQHPQQQQQQSERSEYKYLYNGAFNMYGQTAQQNGHHTLRTRQHSTGEDDENTPSSASSTTSSDGVSPMKLQRQQQQQRRHNNDDRKPHIGVGANEQRRAMSAFLSKNFELQETSNSSNNQQQHQQVNKRKYQHVVQDAHFIKEEMEEHFEDQENKEQLIRSPPAYNHNNNNKFHNGMTTTVTTTLRKKQHQQQQQQQNQRNAYNQHHHQQHRLDLFKDRIGDKENQAATFLTQMEYQNLNKIGTQFQNYVKDIINKYYAETPLMFPAMPTATTTPQQAIQSSQQNYLQESPSKRRRLLSETEEYIEYLRNKEDITLTITPKNPTTTNKQPTITAANKHHQQQQQQTQLKRAHDFSLIKRESAVVKTEPQYDIGSNNHSAGANTTVSSVANNNTNSNSKSAARKSLSQLATLLPLLADAASQQQYLTAPLDFSKKNTTIEIKTEPELLPNNNTNSNSCDSSHSLTLTTTSPMLSPNFSNSNSNSSTCHDKRSSRKQAQPKKIRMSPELVMTMLRDKYLNRLMGHKLSCAICTKKRQMLVFNYHTKGSLALHRFWKHRTKQQACNDCGKTFKQNYSLRLHCRRVHGSTVKLDTKHLKKTAKKCKDKLSKQIVQKPEK